MKNKWMKKYTTLGVLLLLLSAVGLIPSINADIDRSYNKNELTNITIELSGINGVKYRHINIQQYKVHEINNLFETVKKRLNHAKTQQTSIDIFNWAIIQLHEMGLLVKDIDVEKIQDIIPAKLNRNYWCSVIEKSNEQNKQQIDDNENRNCFIAGHTNFSLFASISTIPRLILLSLLSTIRIFRSNLLLYFIEKIHDLTNYSFPLLTFIYEQLHINLFMLNMYLSLFQGFALPFLLPIDIGGIITFGYSFFTPSYYNIYRPSEGWVYTNGQNGIIKWNGTFYGHLKYLEDFGLYVGASGYIGIKIWLPFNTYFMGFASKVKLDSFHP